MKKLPEPYQSLFDAMLWDCGAEAVPILVGKGANLNYRDPYMGRTALYVATHSNRMRIVEALLQHGADPNQRFTYRSPVDGHSEVDRVALHYVSSAEVAAMLIQAGADVHAADFAGTTPLMCAAIHGHASVVKALLAAGASPLLRQDKRRGRKPHTARELAESKIKFFSATICEENQEEAEKRLRCYEEIRDILLESERRVTFDGTTPRGSQ